MPTPISDKNLQTLAHIATDNQTVAIASSNQPSFTLTQNDKTVSITDTTGLSGFQYFEATDDPDCSSATTTGWLTDSDGSVSNLDDDDWICFKAKDNSNTYGYAELEVDLTPLAIGITQDEDSLKAGTPIVLETEYEFGFDVSIDGDYAAVGASKHNGYSAQ